MQTAEPKGSSVFPLQQKYQHTHTLARTQMLTPLSSTNSAHVPYSKATMHTCARTRWQMTTHKRTGRPAFVIVHVFGYHSMRVSLHVSSPCVTAVSALQRIPCQTCTRQTGSRAGSCRCTSPRRHTWSVLLVTATPFAYGSEESLPSTWACVRVPDLLFCMLQSSIFDAQCTRIYSKKTKQTKKTTQVLSERLFVNAGQNKHFR